MPVMARARPARRKPTGHSPKRKRRAGTREIMGLLHTLALHRAPNHLRARLHAIPDTELVRA
jgi:hypothetical protein